MCDDLGQHTLKGVAAPMPVHLVRRTSDVQSRLEVVATRGLTPLIGREQEVGILLERWAQVREGRGQVVVLSGDAGIGKSRLLQVLHEHLAGEPHMRWECRSSPYYHQSAWYPLIDLFQRVFQAAPDRLAALEQRLAQYHLATEEIVPLLAPLLSIALPDDRYAPLALSPQQQRRQTLQALHALVVAPAAQQPLLFILENLHWTDPSTLEWLESLIAQVPTTAMMALLTCHVEFQPPWGVRSHVTPLTLQRFTRAQIELMVERLTGGKTVPAEVMQHLVEKSDGVPLYVEEMTKALLESGALQDSNGHYALIGPLTALAIPATVQDSLNARLDRLGHAKGVAQRAATIGRQFSYALLHAISQDDETTLQDALTRLVEAELVYPRDVPPHATYTFKHALIQDTAYQSLLRQTRQQMHARIAQVLEEQFPETAESQPELLAYHYTEAGLAEQAVAYWQRAGQQALQRSTNPEAMQHFTTALKLLSTLPESLSRHQQELALQIALGPAVIATRGYAAPEVEQLYTRAQALCRHIDDRPKLFSALRGLCRFHFTRGALHTARRFGEELYRLAQDESAPVPRLEAHGTYGIILFALGEYAAAWTHLEQGITLADPTVERQLALRHDLAPRGRVPGYRSECPVVPGLSSAGHATATRGVNSGSRASPSL